MNIAEHYYKSMLAASEFDPIRIKHPNAWVGHLPFAYWLINCCNPELFVELGTHTGNSYFSFCQSVRDHSLSTKCFAIDTWGGDVHAGFYSEHVFDDVSRFNQDHFSGFSRLLKMKFDEALDYFDDSSIGLLHIDGLHSYEAVKHDFDSWLPKLKDNAIVLFHDTNVRERGFGVWKLFQELKDIYPYSIEFIHSHGLGVIQIGGTSSTSNPEFDLNFCEDEILIRNYFASLGAKHLLELENKDLLEQIGSTNHALLLCEEGFQNIQRDMALQEEESRRLIAYKDGVISSLLDCSSMKVTKPLRAISSLFKKSR